MWSRPPCVTGRRSTRRTTVTSVVSRIGIASTSRGSEHRRDRRPGGRPARGERERGEQEPEQLAARVAHEDPRPVGRPEVERQEAGAREREREGEDEDELVLVHGRRVDREVDARDRRERRREPVHVVEQVEGVRDPHEPEERDRDAEHVVLDELDPQARRDRDRRRADLRRELRERAQVPDVVDQPGGEDEPRPGEDPGELPGRFEGADGERQEDAGRDSGRDGDPAERRRRAVVPALAARLGHEPRSDCRGAQQGPQGERRDWECGDRDDRVHAARRVAANPARSRAQARVTRPPAPGTGGSPSQ